MSLMPLSNNLFIDNKGKLYSVAQRNSGKKALYPLTADKSNFIYLIKYIITKGIL